MKKVIIILLFLVLFEGFIIWNLFSFIKSPKEKIISPLPDGYIPPIIKTVFITKTVYANEPESPQDYIRSLWGSKANEALLVARCESGIRPNAINKNKNGTVDVGVFQINSVHGHSIEKLTSYKFNIDTAFSLYKRSGWKPWYSSRKCHHLEN